MTPSGPNGSAASGTVSGDLFDAWITICDGYRRDGVPMQYQRVRSPDPEATASGNAGYRLRFHTTTRKFRTNRSLRDVEPQVNLFLEDLSSRLDGGGNP